MTPSEIPGVLNDAINAMWQGRVRPVEIEVPQDTLFAKEPVQLRAPSPGRQIVQPDPDKIEEAAKVLGQAKNPVIVAGGGIHSAEAWEELRQVAELLQAPVIMTSTNGKGAISWRHPLAMSTAMAGELAEKADVFFAVGTRFVEAVSYRWKLDPGRTVVQLDVDPEEVGRNYPAAVGIVADAKLGLAALLDRIPSYSQARPSRQDEYGEIKQRWTQKINSIQPQADFAMAIRNELPDDGLWVSEQTQIGYWANIGLPIYEPRTFLGPGYQGTLGYGFPTALGAAVANPDKVTVSINGDGGFGFALSELATMAKFEIPLIVVVFDDNAYGNVRRIQQEQMGGRLIASDLLNPDFKELAELFGIVGRRAETPADLQTQFREAIKAKEPTLIHVPVGPMPNPWTVLGIR
jgi:acetolactate synthase-1/2/3 large subunit